MRIDLHETFFIQLNLGVFQAEIGAVRHASDRDQHAVVKFGKFFAVVFGFDFDLLADRGHFHNPGLEADFLEHFPGIGHDGPRQVGIRAGQNRVQRLDQNNLAAERGIDGAEFHADVTAADDEQVFRNVLNLERLGGSHHARVAEVKRLRHRRNGTDRQNRLLVFDELLARLRLDAQFV